MKIKLLPIFLVAILTSCDQSLIKDVTINGSLIYDAFVTDEEKGFSMNTLRFTYKDVTTNENEELIFASSGYIRSYAGIPYSNLVVESNQFTVYGYDYYDKENESYTNFAEVEINENKSSEGQYTYYIGGKKEFMIINQNFNSITISKLYFYSND